MPRGAKEEERDFDGGLRDLLYQIAGREDIEEDALDEVVEYLSGSLLRTPAFPRAPLQ